MDGGTSPAPRPSTAARRAQARAMDRRGVLGRIADWVFGYDVFISYGRADFPPDGSEDRPEEPGENYPLRLTKMIEERGYRVFLDLKEYAPGDVLPLATRRRVRMSRHFVLLAAPRSLTSEWVAVETAEFMARRRRRGAAPIVINFDGALDAFAAKSAIADQALAESWLYIEDTRDDGRARPSARLVEQLIRRFTGLRKEALRLYFFGTVAAVMTVIAILAGAQWMRAERERASADRAAAAALSGVDAIIGELAQNARDYEGVPTRVIEGVLLKADDVLETLDSLRQSDAIALRAGSIRRGVAQSQQRLRNFELAEQQAREAVDQLDALVNRLGEARDLREARARAWLALGGVFSAQERAAEARAAYATARAIVREQSAESPDLELLLLGARANAQMGTALLIKGDHGLSPRETQSAALDAYEEAVAWARRALNLAPGSPKAVSAFIIAARSWADLASWRRDLRGDARELYEEAIEKGRRTLTGEEAANIALRALTAGAMENLAALMRRPGPEPVDRDGAAALMAEAALQERRVAESDPENGARRERFAYVATKSAALAAEAGRADAAAQARRAVSVSAAHLLWTPAPTRLSAQDFLDSLALAGAFSGEHARLAGRLAQVLPDCPALDTFRGEAETSSAYAEAETASTEPDLAPPRPIGAPAFTEGKPSQADERALAMAIAPFCGALKRSEGEETPF